MVGSTEYGMLLIIMWLMRMVRWQSGSMWLAVGMWWRACLAALVEAWYLRFHHPLRYLTEYSRFHTLFNKLRSDSAT
jgi:hypothetical protein